MIEIKIDDSYDELYPISVEWGHTVAGIYTVAQTVTKVCVKEEDIPAVINDALQQIAENRTKVVQNRTSEGKLSQKEIQDLMNEYTFKNLDAKEMDHE